MAHTIAFKAYTYIEMYTTMSEREILGRGREARTGKEYRIDQRLVEYCEFMQTTKSEKSQYSSPHTISGPCDVIFFFCLGYASRHTLENIVHERSSKRIKANLLAFRIRTYR